MTRFVSALLLLGCSALPVPAAPEPAWHEPEYPWRIVFFVPEDAQGFVLLNVPLEPGSFDPPAAAAATNRVPVFLARSARGEPLDHRVVHADSEQASVLIRVGQETGARVGALYGTWAAGPGVGASRRDLADPNPVRVDVLRHPGRSEPTSWEKMLHLSAMSPRPVDVLRRPEFGAITLPEDEERRKRGGGAPNWIAVLRTFVLCPRDGEYRFALNCQDAGFLLVDGELAVAWPGKHPADGWREGRPRTLRAGPHRIEVYNSCRGQDVVARVGWRIPGQTAGGTAVIPTSLLITAAETSGKRIERMDRTLHADFEFERLASYAFWGRAPVFTPVRFRNTTKSWIPGGPMKSHWLFREGYGGIAATSPASWAATPSDAGAEAPVHVFATPGLCRGVLEVRDQFGFTASCEKTVDCRLVEPRQFVMAADLTGLPAVTYSEQRLVPLLRVTGQAPPRGDLQVNWEIRERSGGTTRGDFVIRPDLLPASVSLGRWLAGTPSSIVWRVTHQGAALESGAVSFQRPPFSALPARAEGDRLYDAQGAQLVMLPYRFGGQFSQPPVGSVKGCPEILLFDDWLNSPTRRADAGEPPAAGFEDALKEYLPAGTTLRVAHPAAWDESPGTYGPLLKLVQASEAVGPETGLVILSIGVQDMLRLKDPDAFELHAAALSDMLAGSLRRPVVWVTPAPCLEDVGRVRAFAAAVRRVADARNMPVVDLFTAFMGFGKDRNLFFEEHTFVLTGSGRKLTAQLITRAILTAGEEHK